MRTTLFLLAFAGCYLALQLGSTRANSATFDEPVHLAAGYLALTRADYGFDITHPPLLRMWAALPLLAAAPVTVNLPDRRTMTLGDWTDVTNDLGGELVYNRPDGDRQLGRARFMIGLLGVALGLLIFAWVHEWLGPVPAAVILVCYLFAPNLSAHAGLVTTDLGVTLFFFATIYFLWRLHRHFTAWNLTGLGVAFALALTSKFSAVILGPIAVVLLVLGAVEGREITWRRAALAVAVLAGAGVAGIWAVYQFQYEPAPGIPPWRADLVPLATKATPRLAAFFGWVDAHRLLPSAYSQGFIWSQASATDMSAYLLGEHRLGGWWYYFPVALVLKTPVGKQMLIAVGLFLLLRRRLVLRWCDAMFIFLPPLIYFGIAMASDINLGVRHVLPVSPFGFLIAAVAAGHLWTHGRGARLVLSAAVALWAVGYASVYPHTLTFINLAAGGSARGPKLLADSNLDWGQGLKALKSWMDREGVEQVNFAYFGSIDPGNYGVKYIGLPTHPLFEGSEPPRLPGYVVVSPTVQALSRRAPHLELFYAGLEDQEPVAVVGHVLRIYWCEEWPMPDPPAADDPEALRAHLALGDLLLKSLHWPDQAVKVYRRYLAVRPEDSDATATLAVALYENHEPEESYATFARAISLDANPDIFALNVARFLLSKNEKSAAETFARRAVVLGPNNGRAHEVLGLVLAAQARLPDAEAALLQALRLEPRLASASQLLENVRTGLRPQP
jgi:hypothetical protein